MTRRLVVAAVSAPLLLGIAAAGPALAAADPVTVPATVTDATTATVTASLAAPRTSDRTLSVQPPVGKATSAPPYEQGKDEKPLEAATLELDVVLPVNGRYTATLTGDAASADPERREDVVETFDVEVPPAAPTAVKAVPDGRTVRVTWARGAEADLVGYRVQDTTKDPATGKPATTTAGEGTTAELCPTGRCRLVLGYPGKAASRHRLRVLAVRACPTCQDKAPLTAPAADVVAQVAAVQPDPAVTPTPTPTPRSTRSTTTQLGSRGFGTALQPQLEAPSLPGAAPQVAVPSSTPLPDGTYERLLDYPEGAQDDSVLEEEEPGPGRLAFASSRAAALLGDEGLARSAAVALVLLLLGAHLRRWISQAR